MSAALDLENGLLRAWWFEPLLATISFALFINLYWYHERIRGLSVENNFSNTMRLELGPLFNSGIAYWIGIILWKCIVPPAAPVIPDGIPFSIPELFYVLAELISGIVLYDGVFFFIHWAMHELPCLRSIHHRHHEFPEKKLVVEARHVLLHSILDGSLQVLVNILVQRHTCWGAVKSRLARALHNIIVVWMLTESHTASPVPCIWRRWFVGVREHRMHHLGHSKAAKGGRRDRYQQFFGYLDDLRDFLDQNRLKPKVE